jgi:hypothetical protein
MSKTLTLVCDRCGEKSGMMSIDEIMEQFPDSDDALVKADYLCKSCIIEIVSKDLEEGIEDPEAEAEARQIIEDLNAPATKDFPGDLLGLLRDAMANMGVDVDELDRKIASGEDPMLGGIPFMGDDEEGSGDIPLFFSPLL